MSKVRSDEFLNRAGTGSPTFPKGVISSGVVTSTSAIIGTGVTINSDGIDIDSGIVTATSFVGNLTGNLTGDATGLTGTPSIVVASAVVGSAVTINSDGIDIDAGIVTCPSVELGTGTTLSSPGNNEFQVLTNATQKVLVTSTGGISLNNGLLVERVNIAGAALNSNTTVNLDNGMVHYYTGIGAASQMPNLVTTAGINTEMATGDAISVTIMAAANASNYINDLAIDGVDLNLAAGAWVGGAAPTAGGSGGTDTFTFNILKTASATYTVVANFVKCSA